MDPFPERETGMPPSLARLGVRATRLAILPLALLGAAACDDDRVGPDERSVLLRQASGFVGLWVRQPVGELATAATYFGTDPTVTDTLRLRENGDARWVIVQRDPMDAAIRHRTVIDARWSVDDDTVRVAPRCEPVELCDPAPPWKGALLPDGRLVLLPDFFHTELPSRIYRKVAR